MPNEMPPGGGFLNLLKPPGMTSHDVISLARRILREKKIGHAGTLDPAAAGVLPVAVGQATRLIEYLEQADKSYRVEMKFGFSTDSGDDTGRILSSVSSFTMPSKEEIRNVLNRFTGSIRQTPPAYSAIKIQGKRACDLIRQGREVKLTSRTVNIYRLALLSWTPERILLDVDCSKGTYIRSLCQDIGQALDLPAVMTFLVRRRVGDFRLEDALSLEELAQQKGKALLAPASLLSHLARYDLAPSRERAFCNGLRTHDALYVPVTDLLRVYAADRFIGIGRYDRSSREIVPVKVIQR